MEISLDALASVTIFEKFGTTRFFADDGRAPLAHDIYELWLSSIGIGPERRLHTEDVASSDEDQKALRCAVGNEIIAQPMAI